MKRRCMLLIGTMLACIVAGLVLSLAPERWWIVAAIGPEWFNAAHLPAYFILTSVAVAWATRRAKLRAQRLLLVGAAIYAFGLALEFIQPLVGRTFSTRDLALNAIGIAAALSVVGAMRYAAAQRIARRTTDRPGQR